jgi:putative membrane protein
MIRAPLRKTALSVALVSIGLALSATTQAAGTTSASAPSASSTSASRGASDAKVSHGDKKFMEEAAQGGMAEVQLGKLAAQKAGSDDVKQFGQKMVDDHSKANDQLKQLASSKGVTLPTDLDHSAKREMDRLSKLSGADFDREYMNHMVSDHKKDIKEFEKAAKSAKDPDIKNFASSTLPTLQSHLQLAQQTDAAIMAQGRSNTARTSSPSGMTPGTTSSTGGGAATGTMSSAPRRPGT